MIAFLDLIDDYENKERFKNLYCKYKGLMAHIAYEKLKNQEDVEDVLQDSFLYIAKNFSKVGDINSNSTKRYVAVITEGYAIKKYNIEKKQLNHLNNAMDIDTDDIISDEYFNAYDKADLRMVINSLNDEYRNLIYFTYVLGYTSKETAEIYGLSSDNIRKKIQFAKLEIKKNLESWD